MGQIRFSKRIAYHFERVIGTAERINDRAGFIQKNANETLFFVFTNIFKQEVCKGYDSNKVVKLLVKNGLLVKDEGRSTISRKPPLELKSVRFYCIKGEIIDA